MDPQACFELFTDAVKGGDFDAAYLAATDYREWIGKEGFPALDDDDAEILILDLEQDRYLVEVNGGEEKWRTISN